jgi:drug/metabolite transporter (DMT)-like permease
MNLNHHQPRVSPILAIGFGILAVSTASIFIRQAQNDVPSLVIAAYRLTIATIVLVPIAFMRHRTELRLRKRWEISLALLSGLFLALHFAAWITSLEYTTVASSVVLVSTTPLWVALLSPITVKEPLTRSILIGMVLVILGSIVIGLSDSCTFNSGTLSCPSLHNLVTGEAFLGDLLALVGAWMAAGYVLIGRKLRTQMSLVPYIFLVYGVAAVILIIIMTLFGYSPWGYPPQAYLWLVLLAIIPQLLGHSTFNWALGYLPASLVAITLMGEPIGSTILAIIFLQETPTVTKIFGAILILIGIYVAARSDMTNKNPDIKKSQSSIHKRDETPGLFD